MRWIADKQKYKEKEELYVKVRDAEKRIISDDVLQQLPLVAADNPYHHEWEIRRRNLEDLLAHLAKKGRPLNILDLGCGNGWMSNRLHSAGHKVTAVDLNITELEQAERVFPGSDSLQWVYANIMEDTIPGAPFDVVILAASCQYFPSIQALKERLLPLLAEQGEIHLYDSMFYETAEATQAKKRSEDYYSSLGFPQMSDYYFHHSFSELQQAGFQKKSAPLFKKLFQKNVLGWYLFIKKPA